jgi:hypothetical protein
VIRHLLAAALCCGLMPGSTALGMGQPSTDWRNFEATWSASGRRHTILQDDGKTAAIVELSGAVVITSGEGLGRGFSGEVIGFDDGEGMSVGRAVWTDERGDHVYIRLTGDAIEGGRRILATITGGSGRYTGIEGDFTFTWQYVVAAEGDRIQGRAVDLTGRVRRAGTPS